MQGRIRKTISIGMMTVICAAVFTSCGTSAVKDRATVMEIDGQIVQKEEYQMLAQSHVAEVKMQYTTDEANRKDFWTTEFEDGRPVDQLIALTTDELVEKKAIAKLAKDAKINKDTDYAAMEESLGNRNENAIYGVTEMELSDYYEYIYTQTESELLECLKKKNPVTEEEVRKAYEADIEDYTSDVSIDLLVAEMDADAKTDEQTQVVKALAEETDVNVLTQNYQDVDFYTITLSSLNTQEGKTGVYTSRWEVASKMQQDEISDAVYADNHVLFMRCLNRSEHVAEPFEDIKGKLESQILTKNARAVIRQEVEQAEVVEKVDLEKVVLEVVQ